MLCIWQSVRYGCVLLMFIKEMLLLNATPTNRKINIFHVSNKQQEPHNVNGWVLRRTLTNIDSGSGAFDYFDKEDSNPNVVQL